MIGIRGVGVGLGNRGPTTAGFELNLIEVTDGEDREEKRRRYGW